MGYLASAAALVVLVCSVELQKVSATVGWIHGGGICGGADDGDNTIYIGVKGAATCAADDTGRPAEFVTMKVEGLAALRESASAYLTNSSKMDVIEPTSYLGPVSEEMTPANGTRFGRAVSGQILGDSSSGAYGFAGTASYLMAEGSVSFNTNEFLIPGANGATETVSGICIVPLVDATTTSPPPTTTATSTTTTTGNTTTAAATTAITTTATTAAATDNMTTTTTAALNTTTAASNTTNTSRRLATANTTNATTTTMTANASNVTTSTTTTTTTASTASNGTTSTTTTTTSATTTTTTTTTTTATTGKQCGPPRTAVPGTYKFSLYGYTAGANFAAWASSYTHIGVRQTVNFTHMGAGASVSFNGDSSVTLANLGATAVTSVLITGASTSLSYTYPTTYNVGSISTGTAVPALTANVIIQAAPHDSDPSSFFVDYIFLMGNGLEAQDGYFVYDPDVTSPTLATTTTAAATTAAATTGAAGTTILPGAATTSAATPGQVTTSRAVNTPVSCMWLVAGLGVVAFVVH